MSPGTAGKVTEEDVTEEVANPANSIKIGDSSGQYEYILLEFEIPETSVAANQYLWDTTTVADGEHTVSAEFGANRAEATVTVDNTKPVITPDIADEENSGKDVKRGTITIDAEASDITSGIAEGSLGANPCQRAIRGRTDRTAVYDILGRSAGGRAHRHLHRLR